MEENKNVTENANVTENNAAPETTVAQETKKEKVPFKFKHPKVFKVLMAAFKGFLVILGGIAAGVATLLTVGKPKSYTSMPITPERAPEPEPAATNSADMREVIVDVPFTETNTNETVG